MKLRQKSGRWYAVAVIRIDGRTRETWQALPIPINAPRRLAMRALLDAEAATESSISPTVTIADLIARYAAARSSVVRAKTLSIYRYWFAEFERRYGRTLISQFSPAEGEAWQQILVDRGLAPASVHQAMRTIKALFAYAVKAGILQRSPVDGVAMVRIPRTGFPPYITMDEFRAVLTGVQDPIQRAAFALAMYAGLRLAEVENLRWEHIDFDAGIITITPGHGWETKSGRARQVPLYPPLRELLEELPRHKGPVVKYTASWITHSWTAIWREYVAGHALNLPGISSGTGAPRHDLPPSITFHGLRHSFATWAALHVPLPVLQSLLGHASITTTMIYAEVRPSMAVEEARKHCP